MPDYEIKLAMRSDADEIYALYHSLIDMPNGTWDEEYPSRELVKYDLEYHDILVMRDEGARIIAAIVISTEDEELAEAGVAWFADVKRWIAFSRLGVSKDMQGKGVAKEMLLSAMALCKQRGYEAVRFLVSKTNPAPQRAYAKLNFDVCGEVYLYEHQWLCYQKRI